ncbi:MAG: DUF3857 domain-containing protein [Leeuwenhoekiella sp.]
MKKKCYGVLLLLIIAPVFLSAQNFKYGKVSKDEVMQKEHPLEPDAVASVLYRNQYSFFRFLKGQGFQVVTEFQERIKIYKPEGFDYATHSVPIYIGGSENETLSGLNGVTYNLVDGKMKETKLRKDGIFDEEASKYYKKTTFTLPNLQAGSVIEYKYTFTTPYVHNIDEIRLQEEIPVDREEFLIKFPEYFNYKMHTKGWLPIPIKRSSDNGTINLGGFVHTTASGFGNGSPSQYQSESVNYTINSYELTMTDVPAIKQEKYAGNMDNYMSAIKFELSFTKFPDTSIEYISNSWEDVCKSIYESDSYENELTKERYFDDEIDAILATATSNEDKMIAVFEFVKRRMAWNGYEGIYTDKGVRSAYKDRTGNVADINLMLVSMFRYAGLDANPVVLSTRDNGIPLYPTVTGFNYVIASVNADDNIVLMDATDKMGVIDLLPEKLINWNGRIIKEGGFSQMVNLSPSKVAGSNLLIQAAIDDDLSVKGSCQSQYVGHRGISWRKNLATRSEEEKRLSLEEYYKGSEISGLELTNFENPYEPLQMKLDFESMSNVEEVGGKIYLNPMLYLAEEENPFTALERKFPVDFLYKNSSRYMFTIKIPEGYQVESLPESAKYSLMDGKANFAYIIAQRGKNIQLNVSSKINQAMFMPENYPDIKKYFEGIIAKQNEKVVLSKI